MLTSACSSKAANGTGALAGQTPGVSPNPPATTAPATDPSATSATSGTTTTTTTTTPTTGTPTTSTPTKVPSGPHLSFSVSQQPACPIVGTSDAPFSKPGTNIILKWNATGGVKRVALSLDEPGFFKQYGTGSIDTYAPQGTVELSFQCDPTSQPNTTHKYTMDTIGGGTSVEITITVTKQTSP